MVTEVEQILKPYLTNPSARKLYTLETSLCEHFEKTLIALSMIA